MCQFYQGTLKYLPRQYKGVTMIVARHSYVLGQYRKLSSSILLPYGKSDVYIPFQTFMKLQYIRNIRNSISLHPIFFKMELFKINHNYKRIKQ